MFRTFNKIMLGPFGRIVAICVAAIIGSAIYAYNTGDFSNLFLFVVVFSIILTFYYFMRGKKASKNRYLKNYPNWAQLYLSPEVLPDYIKAIDGKEPVQGEDDDGLFYFIPYSFSKDDPNKKPVVLALSTIPMQSENSVLQNPTIDIPFEFIGINNSFILEFDENNLKYRTIVFNK